MPNLFKIVVFFILLLSFSFNLAQAELSVGVGPEYFLWREFNPNGSQALEESGFRGVAQLHWQQEKPGGVLFGYEGKLYLGTVTYNGQTLVPPYQPVTTDTAYSGIKNEGVIIFRIPYNNPYTLDLMTSLGWDHWSRDINPQNSNQLEEYDILFLKLGPLLQYQRTNKKLSFGAGGKFPLYTYENAHINTVCSNLSVTDPQFSNCVNKNPPLHPGQQLSFYANIEYGFNSLWSVKLYYDSYRFSKSSYETETQHGFYQPESSMDLIGLQALYHFH
ncbi:MAG: hypothetical protein ACYDBV_11370 [Nitrospiria bacterium]